jgi:hypothetical protein
MSSNTAQNCVRQFNFLPLRLFYGNKTRPLGSKRPFARDSLPFTTDGKVVRVIGKVEPATASLKVSRSARLPSVHFVRMLTFGSSRVAHLQTEMSRSSDMLQEIFEWFSEHLKDPESKAVTARSIEADNNSQPLKVYFELRADDFTFPRATFSTSHLPIRTRSVDQSGSFFRCNCSSSDPQNTRSHGDLVSALTSEFLWTESNPTDFD